MKENALIQEMERWTDNLALSLSSAETQAKLKAHLDFASKFWQYSWRNQWLIAWQCPGASYVKGFRQWTKDFQRHVKAGSKAIRILAPMVGNVENKATGQKEKRCIGFRDVCVFDVSQTEGKPLPIVSIEEKGEDLAPLLPKLEAFCASKGFPVVIKDIGANGALGYADGRETVIKSGLSANGTFGVMVHEIAHNLAHFANKRREDLTCEQREWEAELTSYLVSKKFGIEKETTSFYLANWKATGKDLRDSLDAIAKTAKEIIGALSVDNETISAEIT